MKIHLSELASIAEITAAIGVIVSLVFVGFQLDEANRETRAAAVQEVLRFESYMAKTFIEHAQTWDKVVNGQQLISGGELRKGINLYSLMMIETENRYYQFNSGYLTKNEWKNHINSMRPFLQLPIFSKWRESGGAAARSHELLELFDDLRETGYEYRP